MSLLLLHHNPVVRAADSDITNGITVDSTLDTADANIGDGACDDGDGNCTLRAAIEEANSDPDVSSILFNISGSGVKTIQPTSSLPAITTQVAINGYSQPGASANTAVAPNPLNGTLLIQIDGSNAGTDADVFYFSTGSDNSSIKGLVIGNFSGATAVKIKGSNISVQGNYIGTNPAGTTANPNEVGVNHDGTPGTGPGAHIGGLNPGDRNIISGNTDGPTATGGYPSTDWVIQGNYVGVGADGVTAIPNSGVGGSGAFSIDDCSDVLVGGDQPGAANVISGNIAYGLAPDNSPGIQILGNYIGTDYTGTQAIPNLVGIIISGDQENSVIGGSSVSERNIISGNTIAGIITGNSAGTLQIAGNYVGLNKNGTTAVSNGTGVLLAGTTVVGGSVANRNVVSGNSLFNVSVQGLQTPSVGNVVSGNYIGTNAAGEIDSSITAAQGEGVRISANATGNIIGGTLGNVIAGNRGTGVSVRSLTITQFGVTAVPAKNAILGNQIYQNEPGGPIADAPGLGIDHYKATADTLSFPADLFVDSCVDLGNNTNDAGDPDDGPNGYINYPALTSVTQNGAQATIKLDLDAADSPTDQYRVEFFANDTADDSGHGEGQTYLGSTTLSNGNGQQVNITLPSGTNLTGKSISATATAIDASTVSGYGGTSEFSVNINAVVASAPTSGGQLAATGANIALLSAFAALSILLAGAILSRRTR